MTRILLVRHGETEHNKNGIIQGVIDTALNSTGVEQAKSIATRLQDEDIAAVYASGLERAQHTAEIIAEQHELELRTLGNLHERNYGEFEGEDGERLEAAVRDHGDITTWKPDDGESMEQVAGRAFSAVDTIRKNHTDETVVAVAHGTLIKSLIAATMGVNPGHGHRFHIDNTGLNELTFNDAYGWRIARVNDTNHLEK